MRSAAAGAALVIAAAVGGCTSRHVHVPAPGVVTGYAAPCAGPPAAALQPVTVFAIRDGRTVATQVTNEVRRDRYRFVLDPGRYKISAPLSADHVPQLVLVQSSKAITVNFPNSCD